MTTRVRINIPGSRPIPPVVVRETVEGTPEPAPPGDETAADAAASPAGSGGDAAAPAKKTSSWFQPRKPPSGETPAGGVPEAEQTPPEWYRRQQERESGGPGPQPEPPAPAGGMPPLPVRDGSTPLPPPPPRGGGPSGPTTGPATGEMPAVMAAASSAPPPPGGTEDVEDNGGPTTMDLGGPLPPAPARSSADTAALPVIPDPFGLGRPGSPSGPLPPPAVSAPAPGPAAEPEDEPAPRKSRSKLKLLAVALVGGLTVAYGAGLVLDPEEVPKGTTVLGHDIGGSSTQAAVNQLDAALDESANSPLTLVVGDQEVELKPGVAGLVIDTEATVRAASVQDYNPITVIGSLFGAERVTEPVYAVDEEKLTAALADAAALAGGGDGEEPREAGITFEDGQAIADLGETGAAIDVAAAAETVRAAFVRRAETGRNEPVELQATGEAQGIDAAEIERAMQEFAEPAVSGWVWLQAADVELPFSERTISEFLSMQATDDGSLQPVIDTGRLAEIYGSTFDGIMIDGGAGLVPMTPEHAAAALVQALREPAVADEGPERRIAAVEAAVRG
ncbi:hypothetical protein GCM10009716_13070 [Streptomyces sodiiphilus]|uniref:Peptidoglycan binding domain-containing protein n=1 Tax=Streptomyces sodiiphilus TaxID=226217 RepID=A0ABN2NVJ2_9ACTN